MNTHSQDIAVNQMSLGMTNERKTAIVTGGSQGIGAGIVKAFLDLGYNVVANSRTATLQFFFTIRSPALPGKAESSAPIAHGPNRESPTSRPPNTAPGPLLPHQALAKSKKPALIVIICVQMSRPCPLASATA